MTPQLIDVKEFLEKPEYYFYQHHGFFLLFESINHLVAVVNKILAHDPYFPFIIFMKTLHERDVKVLEKFSLKNVYTFPYPFRFIVAEMRFLVYQKREKIHNAILILRNLKLNRETRDVFY